MPRVTWLVNEVPKFKPTSGRGLQAAPTPRCLLNVGGSQDTPPPAQEAALLKSTARTSKDELLHPSTVDIWVGSFFATWDCPLHWGTLSSIPGLCPPDASISHHRVTLVCVLSLAKVVAPLSRKFIGPQCLQGQSNKLGEEVM